MGNDIMGGLHALNAFVQQTQEEDRQRNEFQQQRENSMANSTIATAEELRAMNVVLQAESKKRDKADRRNMIISIAGLLLMAATLVFAILGVFGK